MTTTDRATDYTIRAYQHHLDHGPAISDMHQTIRQWQLDTRHNFNFGDDSRIDLTDIPGHYLARGGNFWVARDTTGRLLGFVGLKRADADTGEVKRFAVDPTHHREGIGTALVDALVDWAVGTGLRQLRLSTGQREQARGIYERAGFTVYGFDGEYDDWLMRADLLTGAQR